MSSSHKTENLFLNNWLGSDIPNRLDFNRDNSILDSTIHSHHQNSSIHITASERSKWNNPYYIGTFAGNGAGTRSVELECDFTPKWGIIFAVNSFPTVKDFRNYADYNYFALISNKGSTTGVTLDGKQITVIQSSVALSGDEYRNFNEPGVTYVYIVFR